MTLEGFNQTGNSLLFRVRGHKANRHRTGLGHVIIISRPGANAQTGEVSTCLADSGSMTGHGRRKSGEAHSSIPIMFRLCHDLFDGELMWQGQALNGITLLR